jgi:hypothetical protein
MTRRLRSTVTTPVRASIAVVHVPTRELKMSELYRDCPDCGQERGFAQRHDAPDQCPDAADGWCPEWICAGCGAGVFLGLPAVRRSATVVDATAKVDASPLGRVA